MHRYFYVGNDPVDNTDPSGKSSLSETGATQDIAGTLQSSLTTVASRATEIASRAKIWDIHAYTMWPLHFYMYAEKIGSTAGIRYDVGAEGGWANLGQQLRRGNLAGRLPGYVGSSSANRKSLTGIGKKIVALTLRQWLLWHLSVVGTEDVGCDVDITYGFVPGTQNCLSWTIGATLKALAISRMMK